MTNNSPVGSFPCRLIINRHTVPIKNQGRREGGRGGGKQVEAPNLRNILKLNKAQ